METPKWILVLFGCLFVFGLSYAQCVKRKEDFWKCNYGLLTLRDCLKICMITPDSTLSFFDTYFISPDNSSVIVIRVGPNKIFMSLELLRTWQVERKTYCAILSSVSSSKTKVWTLANTYKNTEIGTGSAGLLSKANTTTLLNLGGEIQTWNASEFKITPSPRILQKYRTSNPLTGFDPTLV